MDIGRTLRKLAFKTGTEVTAPYVEDVTREAMRALLESQGVPGWPWDMLTGKAAKAAYGMFVEWLNKELERLIQENNQFSALAREARECLRRGDLDGEIAALTQIIQLDPKFAPAYHMRGLSHLIKALQSSPRWDQAELDRAHADLLEARRLGPTTEICRACGFVAVSHILRSDVDFQAKDYHRAIERLYAVREFVPFRDVARLESVFQVVSPEMSHRLRALAYAEEENPERVIAEVGPLLQLCPDDPLAYSLRGFARLQKRDHDGAIADLTGALKRDPKWGGMPGGGIGLILGLRGALYAEKGDHDRAIGDLSEARRLDPHAEDFRYQLAYSHAVRAARRLEKGDHDGAIADLSEAQELDPQQPKFRELLGHVHYLRGMRYGKDEDYDRAVADFSEALRLDGQNEEFREKLAFTYYLRGCLRGEKGDYDLAIADLSEARRLDLQNEEFREALATAFKARGMTSLTQAHFEPAAADLTEAVRLGLADEDTRKALEHCNRLAAIFREVYGPTGRPPDEAPTDEQDPVAEQPGNAGLPPDHEVTLESAELAVPTLRVDVVVRNLAYDKVVGVVFTTDHWATVQTAYGGYGSTETSGVEVWRVAAAVGSAREVEFAIFYRIVGAEYWDNNSGRNYRLTTSDLRLQGRRA